VKKMLDMLPKEIRKVISSAFDHMRIAEEEIAAAKSRYPKKAAELHASFRLLCPGESFAKYAPQIYRAHAKELLQRIARGKDLALSTRAELCIVLSEASLLAPLENDYACLYSQSFRVVFPKIYARIFKIWPPRPSFKGAVKELKRKLERKFQSKRGNF